MFDFVPATVRLNRYTHQIRGDGLAECSDFFTGGHGTDSVGTGLDGEAGPDGQDIWGGEIHLEVVVVLTLGVL